MSPAPGAKVLKIAMFDEVDEATAILKVVRAPKASHRPLPRLEFGCWLLVVGDRVPGSSRDLASPVFAVTTRGYVQKDDAGSRTMAVQLKSGATTVASPTLVLTTSGFQWAWRTDLLDPNTGAAWTPAAVNNAQVGPKVIA
jgi:hypothetical protein